jgi:hypothetical protein
MAEAVWNDISAWNPVYDLTIAARATGASMKEANRAFDRLAKLMT